MTRGSVDGLPALTWGRADRAKLATVRQLRQLGLRPAGAQPVAVLVFGHRSPDGPRRATEYASLYRIAEAAPKRAATAAQRAAIDKALAARRTCRDCGVEQDYYLPAVERRCGPCSEVADCRDHDDLAGGHDEHSARGAFGAMDDDECDGWRAEHDAAMRAEDPHREIAENDVTDTHVNGRSGPDVAGHDRAGHELDPDDEDSAEADGSVAIPVQRTEAAGAEPADDGAEAAHDAVLEPVRGDGDHEQAAVGEETGRAVERARYALARIGEQRSSAAVELSGAGRARAQRLARSHADDRAAAQQHHEMGGLAR